MSKRKREDNSDSSDSDSYMSPWEWEEAYEELHSVLQSSPLDVAKALGLIRAHPRLLQGLYRKYYYAYDEPCCPLIFFLKAKVALHVVEEIIDLDPSILRDRFEDDVFFCPVEYAAIELKPSSNGE